MPGQTRAWVGFLTAFLLAACSGGRTGGGPPIPAQPTAPTTAAEAARFLTQASFGANDASISAVRADGYAEWIAQQSAIAPTSLHQTFVENRLVALRAVSSTSQLGPTEFYESFWQQAATADDQLRQRIKFALSEIFVISLVDPTTDIRGAASYYDMLGADAFGNFRTLLEQVSLHPMMGTYLTWLGNQKEDPTTGRHPDENYAREVMQLMSIGLFQLNIDGTQKLNANGSPIATYSSDDISGLAKVFTGYSWYSPTPTAARTFFGKSKDANATVRAMIPYPVYHSTSAKSFLGTTIAASATPDAAGDLRIALDTLFNHPNVGPFISKQLIQRLVTSNPSPAYVGRVATVFNNNGKGVRGDMAAVVKAILTDADARGTSAATADPNYGKLREPVVRMANWMRAFGVTSQSGAWLIPSTSANTSLSQSALASPSVFNFWRPGYSPPQTKIGNLGYVAPEFQSVDEVSVAGYLNTMQTTIDAGIGNTPPGGSGRDVRATYATEMALAGDANSLVDRMNLLLFSGQMSTTLRARMVDAVNSVAIPGGTATAAQISAAQLNRAKLAIFMSMASAEYLAQR